MKALLIFIVSVIGLSNQDIILINDTGLQVARIEIGQRTFEGKAMGTNKILVSVTPEKHHMRVVFVGGSKVDWPKFNFKGVHQIIFERIKNKIEARIE